MERISRTRSRLFAGILFATIVPIAVAQKNYWRHLRNEASAALYVTRDLPKLRAERYGDFAVKPDVMADRVSYVTDYDLRVPAVVYRPTHAPARRLPALIIVNGDGGDKASWYAYWAGILYARAGAVVLTFDPLGEFERNRLRLSDTKQRDQPLRPDDMARRLAGLMIDDVRQAVSYLGKRKDVDRKRIAVLGYAAGSFITVLTCGFDNRINSCVLAGGGNLDERDGGLDSAQQMSVAIPYRALKFVGDRGPQIYNWNAHRGPVLIINGTATNETEKPKFDAHWFGELRRKTIELRGSSHGVFDIRFVAGPEHAPYFLTLDAALWLNQKLHFPNWQRDNIIRQLPATNIRDWFAAHASELSEAKSVGRSAASDMTALENDIAPISKDRLHAVPEPKWSKDMDQYIYETWVDRAQTAERGAEPK